MTGSTSGIGAALAKEIVARGDKVISSGRQVERKLSHLKSDSFALLELDTANGLPEIESKIEGSLEYFRSYRRPDK